MPISREQELNMRLQELKIGDYIGGNKIVWAMEFYNQSNNPVKIWIVVSDDRKIFKGKILINDKVEFWGIKKEKFSEALARALTKFEEIRSRKITKLKGTWATG